MPLYKKPALVLAFLCLTGMLYAGIWDNKTNYQKAIVITVLREGEVTFPAQENVRVLYSLIGNLHSVWEGGSVALNLHIQKNEELFRGPVRIHLISGDSTPLNFELDEPNNPVSLPKGGLVYSFPFEYRLGSKLRARVVSPQKSFPEFNLEFAFPRRRF